MSDADTETFKDAEEFLAELGVRRDPIVVRSDPPDDGSAPTPTATSAPGTDGTTDVPRAEGDESADAGPAGPRGDGPPPPSAAEAKRIATEVPPPDEVQLALAYVRRSTAAQPASEGRLRGRLADRGHDEAVVEAAMQRARAERLVDDLALSAALVAEWLGQGHAPRRLRDGLRRRGFDEEVVEVAVGRAAAVDQTAVAFDLARRRAETLAHLPPETAYRRVVGYVARRGHGEGLARKAARDAVYDQRHDARVAGH